MPLALRQRLRAIGRRIAPRPDVEDALQQLMIDVWLRGATWHEGRMVLHLKSILRNQRRAHAARVRREALYVLMTCGEDPA